MSVGIRRWGIAGLAAGLIAMASAGVVTAQGKDPAFGTWKLNVAKSKFSPGPAPKESTLTIEPDGPGRKVSVASTTGDGTAVKWGYTGNFDKKEYKVSGNNPDADVVMLRRISANATRTTYKKGGKQTLVNGVSVSPDGKTLTVAQTGVNGQGQAVKNSLVFEKQ
jgi:hypothetical protein